MSGFFYLYLYLALIVGQAFGWLFFYPHSEQLDSLYWRACVFPGKE